MSRFEIIEGGLSPNYNHFNDYEFADCTVSNTRLMGVLAMRSEWVATDGSGSIMTILMHLDFSEYGVDEYSEYFHPSRRQASLDPYLESEWTDISGNLGGEMNRISPIAMMHFIESSLEINEANYSSHDEDILEFRDETLPKVRNMLAALRDATSDESLSLEECMYYVSPPVLTKCEVINYYIMRLCDLDLEAATYLSDIPMSDLAKSAYATMGISTLVRNNIKPGGTRDTYECHSVVMNEQDYYYIVSTISLHRVRPDAEWRIASAYVTTHQKMSGFEAALQLRQPEYISVFRFSGLSQEFNPRISEIAFNANRTEVPAGILYTVYKTDNSHVDSYNYMISRDLYGAYLVTAKFELVMMSNEPECIEAMEADLQGTHMFGSMDLKGRYKFDSQIFQSFATSSGLLFEDIIDDADGK